MLVWILSINEWITWINKRQILILGLLNWRVQVWPNKLHFQTIYVWNTIIYSFIKQVYFYCILKTLCIKYQNIRIKDGIKLQNIVIQMALLGRTNHLSITVITKVFTWRASSIIISWITKFTLMNYFSNNIMIQLNIFYLLKPRNMMQMKGE